MIKHHDTKQNTPEWLNLRKGKVTASNALKLLTDGKNRAIEQNSKSFNGNYWTERGHVLEDEALDVYKLIKKCELTQPGFITNTDYPDCGYSPDSLNETEDVLVEVKCFNTKKHLSIGKDNIPVEVIAQCQFGMMVADKKYIDLVLYHPPSDEVGKKEAIKIIRLERDEDIIKRFEEKLNGN